MLGLKHGVNLLVSYDPEWPAAFEEERTRIRSAVGDVARGIEHYGSTAVVGLRAKPIIDILLGVAPLANWIKCKAPLESLGYDYAENAGVPGHFIFGRGRDRSERTHLVHVVEFDGEPWRSNLAFRDALRADESLRANYLRMKEQAVALAPEGRAKYNELKHAFIERFKGPISQSSIWSRAVATTTLYRPVGPAELKLIEEAGWRAFPPRLPEQPIFYPVLNEEYAAQIARRWNVPESGSGYVTAFEVDADYLSKFEVKQVGGREHLELWVPAEELAVFNAHIVGVIRVIRRFEANGG